MVKHHKVRAKWAGSHAPLLMRKLRLREDKWGSVLQAMHVRQTITAAISVCLQFRIDSLCAMHTMCIFIDRGFTKGFTQWLRLIPVTTPGAQL